jgi:hypothetical protein
MSTGFVLKETSWQEKRKALLMVQVCLIVKPNTHILSFRVGKYVEIHLSATYTPL